MIKSVSSTILRTDSLQVKLSVTLLDNNGVNSAYSIFESMGGDYLLVNTSSHISLQYRPKIKIPWDASHVVHINDYNIFQLRQTLQKFYEIYTKPNTFIYYKSGAIEYNGRPENVVMLGLKRNEFLKFEPAVIIDPISKELIPGVRMCLNLNENMVELSSDEFEAFMYKMMQINISSEGLQLLNTSLLVELRGNKVEGGSQNSREPIKKSVHIGQPSIFQRKEATNAKNQNGTVIDNTLHINKIRSLDDLE